MLSENHESGLHHEYLDREKVGIYQKSFIRKIRISNFENIRYLKIFWVEIFMMNLRFVVFMQSRYFLQKKSSKNIAGAKSYASWKKNGRIFQKSAILGGEDDFDL